MNLLIFANLLPSPFESVHNLSMPANDLFNRIAVNLLIFANLLPSPFESVHNLSISVQVTQKLECLARIYIAKSGVLSEPGNK